MTPSENTPYIGFKRPAQEQKDFLVPWMILAAMWQAEIRSDLPRITQADVQKAVEELRKKYPEGTYPHAEALRVEQVVLECLAGPNPHRRRKPFSPSLQAA